MPKNDVLSKIFGAFRRPAKEPSYELFRDGLGNFEIFYPKGWKYDENIAVVDGKYAVTFESRDGLSELTISVDIQLPSPFDFDKYAKEELESPSSGIYTPITKGDFRKMAAFLREYSYSSGGRAFFGGGIMFHSGNIVFSISWSAPKAQHERLKPVFDHMVNTLAVRESFVISKKSSKNLPGVEVSKAKKK